MYRHTHIYKEGILWLCKMKFGNSICRIYFCENRHDRKTLEKIINNFEKKKKTRSTNNNKANNYFSLDTKNWTKNQKKIQKFGFRAAFQTGPNLKNILCKKQS